MGSQPVLAVTFDLWDTLVIDDSDEVQRAARGLPTKVVARRECFRRLVHEASPELTADQADQAWDTANAAFRKWWKQEHHTPPVSRRLDVGLKALGLARPDGYDAAVHELSTMEVEIPPDLLPGAAEALAALAARYPLAIISDSIVTPAKGLRQILENHGLAKFFATTCFSDEVGASKPDPRPYHAAARALGVNVRGLVHVGDRQETDVDGAHAVGARAVYFTGAVDRGPHTADVLCTDLRQLPDLIAALGG